MRTTLDIDADVLTAAKEISARTRRSAGRVLSDLARKALSAAVPLTADSGAILNGFETIPRGDRIVTTDLVGKLIEESEL